MCLHTVKGVRFLLYFRNTECFESVVTEINFFTFIALYIGVLS